MKSFVYMFNFTFQISYKLQGEQIWYNEKDPKWKLCKQILSTETTFVFRYSVSFSDNKEDKKTSINGTQGT